jgi:hypothetical protein
MLVSFTGAELHFHKCGHTGKFYTDIHFTETDPHKNHVNSCCTDQKESCCAESCSKELNHDTCCTDLTKEINTDKDYNFSNHSFKTEIHELVLSQHYKMTETELSDQNEGYADKIPFYISPPHSSKIELLL